MLEQKKLSHLKNVDTPRSGALLWLHQQWFVIVPETPPPPPPLNAGRNCSALISMDTASRFWNLKPHVRLGPYWICLAAASTRLQIAFGYNLHQHERRLARPRPPRRCPVIPNPSNPTPNVLPPLLSFPWRVGEQRCGGCFRRVQWHQRATCRRL
jgi:hypothetical protein